MKLPPGLTEQQLIDLSVELERRTGFDSIPTIERVYPRSETGPLAYRCVFPGCRSGTRSAVNMWHHVHWTHHPKSFDVKYAELSFALLEHLCASG